MQLSHTASTSAALLAISLLAACGSPSRNESEPQAPPAAVAPAPPESGPRPERPSSECADSYRKLQEGFRRLPNDFRDPGRPAQDLIRDVEELRSLARDLLKKCPAGPERPAMEYMLAYLIYTSFDRSAGAGEALPFDLATEGLELARSAAAAFEKDPARSAECHALLGHLFRKRAAYQGDEKLRRADLASLRAEYSRLLALRPDWPDRTTVHMNLVESLLEEGDCRSARKHIESTLAADGGLPDRVSLDERLFDALTACGDLEAMEEIVHRRLSEYPERIAKGRLSRWETGTMENWLDVAEFWLGHIRLAMGDIPRAKDHLQRHIDALAEKEAKLKAKGESLPDIPRIVRDFRTYDLLAFIADWYGKPPEMDLDLIWSTPQKVKLSEARGKSVVAILFLAPSFYHRGKDFLLGLDAYWKRERSRGLDAVMVSYLDGSLTHDEQTKSMRADLKSFGVDMPAGFDPHLPDPKIIKALAGIVGSPSFVAIDRQGRMAWYLPDPRWLDVKLAERVLERLLGEK